MNSIPQSQAIVSSEQAGQLATAALMHQAGQAANKAAAAGVFGKYQEGKAPNSKRRHAADLATFAEFLGEVHPALKRSDFGTNPEAWAGLTWGVLEAFREWMKARGYSLSTVNFKISTCKVYAKLAARAGAIKPEEYLMIKGVEGYSHKEFIHVDETRAEAGQATRKGAKKADAVSIKPAQAKQLKTQPNTPQGRRDAVLMCILLDHGLRCGEVALLRVENFRFVTEKGKQVGYFDFDRPKVQKRQTHKMTDDTYQAVRAYLDIDHPQTEGPLLLATTKGGRRGSGGGKLGGVGMTERAITKRVEYLGELIGLSGLSAHDCRHYWATQAAKFTPIDRLRDAGGWSSLAMPGRYIAAAAIANEGVNLGAD